MNMKERSHYIFEPGKNVQVIDGVLGYRTNARLKSYLYLPGNKDRKWFKCIASVQGTRTWRVINQVDVPPEIQLKAMLLT